VGGEPATRWRLVGSMKNAQTLDVGETPQGFRPAPGISASLAPFLPPHLLQFCAAALDTVAAPMYAVRDDGWLLFANRAARGLLRQGRWLGTHKGRITSMHPESATAFDSALKRLRCGIGTVVLLSDERNGREVIVAIAPTLASNVGHASSADRLGLIWLTPSDSDGTPVRHLARLFNLSRAEQRLLSELVSGIPLRQAAERLDVSIHTARNQLKAVLSKTGRHSQAQLLTLVARMASLRLPEDD
jgi:DNA-binding CsgD family transcriptional regulator